MGMTAIIIRDLRLLVCALLLVELGLSTPANAVEFNSFYAGPDNGRYSDANNWSPNMVPMNTNPNLPPSIL
jgi:hypothetical protein